MTKPLAWAWLGRVRYRAAWEMQECLRDAVLAGQEAEALLLLEHEPVVTLGRSARRANVLVSEAELARRGIELCETSRGGDATFHGPGQLVGYAIVRLERGVLAHVRGMLEGVADGLRPLGVECEFRRETPGLWVGPDKLCAVGVHIRRGVAIHGFALNVVDALDGFTLIVPCGLNAGVTSLARLGLGGREPRDLAAGVAHAVAARFGREPVERLALRQAVPGWGKS